MPAKKIIEAVGSTWAVMGSSIATVTAGPRPGSTPMAVPSAQPRKDHIRLIGVAAEAKPASSWFQVSMRPSRSSDPAAGREAGQAQAQQLAEEPEHRGRDGQADRGVDERLPEIAC